MTCEPQMSTTPVLRSELQFVSHVSKGDQRCCCSSPACVMVMNPSSRASVRHLLRITSALLFVCHLTVYPFPLSKCVKAGQYGSGE